MMLGLMSVMLALPAFVVVVGTREVEAISDTDRRLLIPL
jgi:hypothetical protein